MSRTAAACTLLGAAAITPVTATWLDWDWYLDGPMLVLALAGGYAAGAWLTRTWAAVGVALVVGALVGVNQFDNDTYHWLDDLIFFLVVVGGPAAAGAAVTARARQVDRLTRLQAELDEVQRIEVAAARLDEQARIMGEVHAGLAEQIAAIGIRAEGARRAQDVTALAAIEGEARSVLDRLRDALGSLRAEEREASPAVTSTGGPAWSVLDVVIPAAIGLSLAIETAVVSHAQGPLWTNAVAAVAVAAPLVARRRHPILATGMSSIAGVVMSAFLTPIPETVTGVGLLVMIFYSVGAWCRRGWWVVGWAVATAGMLAMEVVSGQGDDGADGDSAWIVLIWTVGAVAVGRITAGWQERVQRTQGVVDELERARGAAVRLAVAQEREALASELHDTVAHAMTVVCLQAGAHQRVGNDHDDALQVIATVAEKSLVELRDGLEAMESADHPLDPSRIAAMGRRVGVDVRVHADVTASGPATTLAHRVIREALVNIARHAPGAAAEVRVHRSAEGLSVEVIDDGSPQVASVPGTGTGLRGLASTLEAAGGALEWGRREPHGFRVAALVPTEAR